MFEENKEICRRLLEEAFGKGNYDTIDQTVARKCRLHDSVFPSLQPGSESLKQHVRDQRAAFPDLSCTCDDVIAERDEVVIHWTCRGTHRGDFLNFAPTNRSAMVSGTSIFRVENSQITELFVDWNLQSLLDQLGLGMTEQEANKALAKRFLDEIWNRKKPKMIHQFIASDYLRHSPNGTIRGAEGLEKEYDTYVTAFPDCHIRVDDAVGEGDRVVLRYTVAGTNTGKLLDTPATRKSVTIPGVAFFRIVKGKIAEEHVTWDRLDMMQQLGIEPAKALRATR
jgi:steroid delta-isomerase-like uncharacterized protein